MKKIIAAIAILLPLAGFAQIKVIASVGVEKTVTGLQYGALAVVETKKSWGIGPFYQAGVARTEEGLLKDPFYGLAWQIPIARSQKILFVGVIRTGMVNRDFFVVAPSFETRMMITSKAGVSAGAGIRSGYPSMSLKLFVKISQ